MIEFILNILKMLLMILPLVALCLVSKKINFPKADRSKQYLMPIVAAVYVLITMLFSDVINETIGMIIKYIPIFITYLGRLGFLPVSMGNKLLELGNYLHSLLRRIDLHFWLFFISNTVILLAFFGIKKAFLAIFKRTVKNDGAGHTRISGVFYEYFSEKSKWCLRDSYAHARSAFKVFYYTAIVLSSILMLVSRFLYYSDMIAAVFYPVFGILMIGELYFYLDGVTRQEYSEHILGEDENAYRTVNYSLLRKFLRSVFGDKLLTENTSINNALTYGVTTDDIIRGMETSEDPKVVSFATYMSALNKTGFTIDHNYLNSSLDLLCGKSILFNNPFYNDLIPYAFYPMNRILLSHRKVLIVLGRHSIEDDIIKWVENGIEAVTNIPFMWNIGLLGHTHQDLDIGIITRSDVLDMELHNANSDFLENVGYFVVIEPSKLLTTAQIGLNMIAKKCKTDEDKNVVFCLCDKNCDGLVDAMSHTLMTNLTEVSATNKHMGTSSYMCWGADDEYLHHRLVPNISRYLGMGTELSFAALKNQVSKTKWYGGETFPVADMRWIDKQYYYALTKYANLPTNQEAMDSHFETSANFWGAGIDKNNYFTVEDESNNMFEILRDFSTRSTEQGFINVISSDYLLREYMADNASIFEEDAKAIPNIVADYVRSNRNTILRLVLMLSTFPVSEEFLIKELSLLGISVFNIKKQLWYELYNCYTEISNLCNYEGDYKASVNDTYGKKLSIGDSLFTNKLFKTQIIFNLRKGRSEVCYYIDDPQFIRLCVSQLRSAGYVAEDEKGEKHYLGAELSGHIYQRYLPGQFFTFAGKYYEMQYVTADGQVLVRRAADHINGRHTYRQIREYTIRNTRRSHRIGAYKNVSGMGVIKEYADITVKTPGYYSMKRYNDFESAKKILFEGDNNGIPERVYYNKEILRIELPDFDGKLSDNIRYTVTVLFNEIFATLFAENHPFICAVTDCSFMEGQNDTECLTYSIKFDREEEELSVSLDEATEVSEEETSEESVCEKNVDRSIYIIEDSQLDLGLTIAIERNLNRIFNIIYDYLEWHTTSLVKSLNPQDEPEPSIAVTQTEISEEIKEEKKGIIKRIVEWFKKKFKKKKKSDEPVDTPETPVEEEPSDTEVAPDAQATEAADNEGDAQDDIATDDASVSEETDAADDNALPADSDKEDASQEQDTEAENSDDTTTLTARTSEESEQTPAVDTEVQEEPSVLDETDSTLQEGEIDNTQSSLNAPGVSEVTTYTEQEDNDVPGFSTDKKPYHKRHYLLFGGHGDNPNMDIAGTLDYLSDMGLKRNPLKQAREGRMIAQHVEATFKPGKPNARYCDFCGTEIFGVEYETLADGRDRCMQCSRTAIKTSDEFRKIFEDVKRNMESFFGIKINAGIRVEMVNSKKLHRRLGHAFIPTPKTDARVLGVAINEKSGYTLLVENGAPRMASMLTMAHELTHIWQYINWNDKYIRRKYGKNMRLEIYEGMAKWVEIQYAYLINEPALAKREEILTAYRDDEYGRGFLRYRENYPFSMGTVITRPTPFMNLKEPLDPAFCGTITVNMPGTGINPGDLEQDIPEDNDDNPSDDSKDKPTQPPVKGSIERTPDEVPRYAYNFLSDGEKSAYDMVFEAIDNFEPEVSVQSASVTDTQIQLIVDSVQQDHPELFWFQQGATFYYDTESRIVDKVSFKYCMTRDEAELRGQQIDSEISAFLESVSDSMSDYELTLKVYENIIGLVDYDTIGLEKQKLTEYKTDEPDDLRSIYGVFVNKKAVCAGYAKAMQYLLNRLGIECAFVNSSTHAWNLVKLEGDYYHMDVTWGDGTDTKKEKEQLGAINYDCFCITTDEVLRLEEHIPEVEITLPECTATKCNYHRRQGLFFEEYDFMKIRSVVCDTLDSGKFDVSLKFDSSNVYAQAKQQLIDSGKFAEILQYANLKSKCRVGSGFMYSVRDDRNIIAFYMQKL